MGTVPAMAAVYWRNTLRLRSTIIFPAGKARPTGSTAQDGEILDPDTARPRDELNPEPGPDNCSQTSCPLAEGGSHLPHEG